MVAETLVDRCEALWCPRCARRTLTPSEDPGRWRCQRCDGSWSEGLSPLSSLVDHWNHVFERATIHARPLSPRADHPPPDGAKPSLSEAIE